MTRDQQIRAALTLLAPKAVHRAACRDHIEAALDQIEMQLAGGRQPTKAQRRLVSSYLRLLERVDHQRGLLNFHWFVVGAFDDSQKFIAGQIKRAEEFLDVYKRPQHRTAEHQRLAVKQAGQLCGIWGRQRPTHTKGGQWHKLAAILLGDPSLDLSRHMTKATAPEPGRK